MFARRVPRAFKSMLSVNFERFDSRTNSVDFYGQFNVYLYLMARDFGKKREDPVVIKVEKNPSRCSRKYTFYIHNKSIK